MFQDGKGELGMDHFEVRKFLSIQRHLVLSCVSYFFLAQFHQARRVGNPDADDLPSPHGDQPPRADLGSGGPMPAQVRPVDQPAVAPDPAAQRQGPTQPSKAGPTSIAQHRDISQGPTQVSMEAFVAL